MALRISSKVGGFGRGRVAAALTLLEESSLKGLDSRAILSSTSFADILGSWVVVRRDDAVAVRGGRMRERDAMG